MRRQPIGARDSELRHWAQALGVAASRFTPREQPPEDLSHPAIAVRLDACIQCGRCVRACREEQVNDVIGYAWRGEHAKIVFDCDTRWVHPAASAAANACRPVRPVR